MILQTIFMFLTLILLLYIAYTQRKIYIVALVTSATFLDFLEGFTEEEDEDCCETQQFH